MFTEINVFGHQVVSLIYNPAITTKDVLKSLKELPLTAKVINID